MSWLKILNWDDREFDEEDNIPSGNLAQQNEIDAYRNEIEETVQLLSKLTPNAVLSIDGILICLMKLMWMQSMRRIC